MSRTVTASSMSSSSSSSSSDSSSSIASVDTDHSDTPFDQTTSFRPAVASSPSSAPVKDPFEFQVSIKKEGDPHGITFKNTPVGVTISSVAKKSPSEHLPTHRLVTAINSVPPGSSEEAAGMVVDALGSGYNAFTITITNIVCEDYKETVNLKLSTGSELLGFTVENTSTQPEGGLLITTIDRYSVMEVAGIPVGSVLLAVDGKPLTNLQDFTSAIASLRSREATDYKVEVLIRKGTTRSAEKKLVNRSIVQPARSEEESILREKLRRDVMLKEQRMSRRERRIDFCNGFALTHLEFITNYGNEIGAQRWHSSAEVSTPIVSVNEITPTSSLNVTLIGQRVQMQETAQVLVVVSHGPSFRWYKIPYKEMTAKELSYLELLDNRPPEEPTVVVPLNQLTPSSRLEADDVGKRLQLQSTGQVVRVAMRAKSYAWQYVPDIEWTAGEIRYASTLPSSPTPINKEVISSPLSDMWVDGSPIFSPTMQRRGMR